MLPVADAARPAQSCDYVIPGGDQHREVQVNIFVDNGKYFWSVNKFLQGDPLPEAGHEDEGQHEAGAAGHLDHLHPDGAALRKVHLAFLS